MPVRPPGRAAGRDRRHPPMPGRGRHPRQDDHLLDARPDAGRGGAATLVPHRSRRERDRHQRRLGRGRVAGARGRRELRHLRRARPGDRRAHQRRAGPPRPLRDVRGPDRRLRGLPGPGHRPGPSSAPTTRWRPSSGDASGPRAWASTADADLRHDRARPRPQRAVAFDLAGPEGPLGRLARGRCPGCTTPATPRWRPPPPWAPAHPSTRPWPPWPASPACPGASSSGARPAGSPSSTTTPTCRARSGRRWPRPGPGGWRRVVAVFQPHRYTRTGDLSAAFADAFDDADLVVVTDVYGAGEPPVPGVSGKLVADAVAARTPERPVVYAPDRAELRGDGRRAARAGRPVLHPRGGRPHHPARRAAGRPGMVTTMGDRDRMTLDAVAERLGDLVRRDHPFGALTTYRVGGRAALFVEAGAEADLEAVRTGLAGAGVPVLVLGKGSNLLVADAGFEGLVVRLSGAFADVAAARPPVARRWCRAGGATGLPVLARRTRRGGLRRSRVGRRGARLGRGGAADERRWPRLRHGGLPRPLPVDGPRQPGRRRGRARAARISPTATRRSRDSEVVLWAEFGLTPGDPVRRPGGPQRDRAAGGAATSPAGATPGRCSPTRRATRPGA